MNTKEKNPQPDFTIKCKIDLVKKSFFEIADGKWHETEMIYLLPDLDTTQAHRLLGLHLPDFSTICMDCKHYDIRTDATECPKCKSKKIETQACELPSIIGPPAQGPCRVALMRKNLYCSQHHLVVMNTGVELELKPYVGKTVEVEIFDGKYDSICDTASSINRTRAI